MPKVRKLPIPNGTTLLTICEIELSALAPVNKYLPETLNTLGDFLKEKRVLDGIPIEVMCIELNIVSSTLHRWENSKSKLRPTSRAKIINYLGYDPTLKV